MEPRALTVEDMCNKLRPVYGEKIDKLYFRYSIAEGREEREEIAHLINTLYQKNLNQLEFYLNLQIKSYWMASIP